MPVVKLGSVASCSAVAADRFVAVVLSMIAEASVTLLWTSPSRSASVSKITSTLPLLLYLGSALIATKLATEVSALSWSPIVLAIANCAAPSVARFAAVSTMAIGFVSVVKLCNAARAVAVATLTVAGVLTSIVLASDAVSASSVARAVAVSLIVRLRCRQR